MSQQCRIPKAWQCCVLQSPDSLRELTLPVQPRCVELFEGCGLPGILRVQVLSVLPQPSQRQHKSRKESFALWLLHQEYPHLLPGKFLMEGDAAATEGSRSTSLLCHARSLCFLFEMLNRMRGRNYPNVSPSENVGSNSSLPKSKAG